MQMTPNEPIDPTVAPTPATRFAGLYAFALVFLLVSLLLRVALLIDCMAHVQTGVADLAATFAVGMIFDITAASCLLWPVAVVIVLMPDRLWRSHANRIAALILYAVSLYVMFFDVAAEWLFWQEFQARFNFVAVDYLVYTQELVGNMVESYPIAAIFAALLAPTAVALAVTWRRVVLAVAARQTFPARLKSAAVFLVLPILCLAVVRMSWADVSRNAYNNELARNGPYSMVAAFFDNELSYDQFYQTAPDATAFADVRRELAADYATFLSPKAPNVTRRITAAGPQNNANIVLIVVESLSARFLGAFGGPPGLTPNLDALWQQSLAFSNCYATGTRTVRGLEAVTLSVPPTPGRSIVKRPDNAGLFSVGHVLAGAGYQRLFLYGGYGYFDNMNAFYRGNGFDIVDRGNFADDEITFANAWGVCDGDLYARTLRECTRMNKTGQPFLALVMTTSNHRPYSFPEGQIDLPTGSRLAAVKYTDFTIGRFIENARSQPWFENTLFVIVADHCHNSAGEFDVSVAKYRIPMLLYAPKLVKPRKVDALVSQIDLPPTLLGLLNVSYTSKFFGRDLMRCDPDRALLGNYQKVGILAGGTVLLLAPRQRTIAYTVTADGQQPHYVIPDDLRRRAIGYYQSAAHLFSSGQFNAE